MGATATWYGVGFRSRPVPKVYDSCAGSRVPKHAGDINKLCVILFGEGNVEHEEIRKTKVPDCVTLMRSVKW